MNLPLLAALTTAATCPLFEGDSEAISIPDCRWQSHLKSNGGL